MLRKNGLVLTPIGMNPMKSTLNNGFYYANSVHLRMLRCGTNEIKLILKKYASFEFGILVIS